MSKINVGREYRTNELADIPSNTSVEVYMKNGSIKVYDNIHYPEKFANRIFKNSNDCTKIIVKRGSETYTIEKSN